MSKPNKLENQNHLLQAEENEKGASLAPTLTKPFFVVKHF